MVGCEQADWKGSQEDGLFVDLEGEEKKGKGRVDLKWGEKEGGKESVCVHVRKRERERKDKVLLLKKCLFLTKARRKL